jgi:hypothetical protein
MIANHWLHDLPVAFFTASSLMAASPGGRRRIDSGRDEAPFESFARFAAFFAGFTRADPLPEGLLVPDLFDTRGMDVSPFVAERALTTSYSTQGGCRSTIVTR